MKKEYLLFLILPLSQVLMLFGVITEGRPLSFWGFGGLFLSAAADMLLLYILIWSSRRKKLNRKLQELTYLHETERIQNEMLEEKQKELLCARSDYENRLAEIRKRLRQGEKEAARKEMAEFQSALDRGRPVSFCRNAIVNAIVNEKKKEMERLEVKADLSLRISCELKLDPLHLCSIFSNLLDNALEALSELPKEERSLELHAEQKGAYLVVRCKNTASRSHALRKRRKGHGYGTQILEYIAKTYEGSYQAGYENGWYTASVMVKAE